MKFLSAYLNSYRDFTLPIWLNTFAQFVNATGTVMTVFLSLYLVNVEHYSVLAMTLVLSVGGAGAIIGSFLGGRAADRFKPVRVVQVCLLLVGIENFLMPFLHSHWLILLNVFFLYLFNNGFRASNMLILFAHCKRQDRTRAMGLNRTAFNLGFSFSTVAGGILASLNFAYFFGYSGISSLIAVALLVWWQDIIGRRQSRREKTPGQNHWRLLLNNRPYLLLLILFLGYCLTFFQIRTNYALYLTTHYGLDIRDFGYLYSLNMLAVVFLEVPLMARFKSVHPIHLITLGIAFVGIGLGMVPFGDNGWWGAASIMLWTLGEILCTSPFFVLAMRYADPSAPGFYMGLFQTIQAIALIIAPLIGGWLYGFLNGNLLWYYCGVSAVILVIACRAKLRTFITAGA